MMLVEPDADDVIPTGRIVALETLIHACALLARELPGDHGEVPHEVTRWRLMTLHAVFCSRGWVLVAENVPRLHRVALRAVASEVLVVGVSTIMATGAIERVARGSLVELIRSSNIEPSFERLERCCAIGVRARCALESTSAYSSELYVIHHQRTNARPLMLDVACRALADTRVEGGWLAAEQAFRSCMARRALRDRHSDRRLVA